MVACEFVKALGKLREFSKEAVDDIQDLSEFKRYLHVERSIQSDMKDILRKMNKSEKRMLFIVCGSTGEGKSHFLSYLKNVDQENLIDDHYRIYNDATASKASNMTAIETLAEELEDFDDNNIELDDGKKLILLINLGKLNDFIESEKGARYQKLKQYVIKEKILTGKITKSEFKEESYFQHLNFVDYHLFTLTEQGVESQYIEELLQRIFQPSENNVFYQLYDKYKENCPLIARCPVRNNYEFLSSKKVQRFVVQLLIETMIKDKTILSTRKILNYIYDILVHRKFDFNKMWSGTNDLERVSEYLSYTTPMLMYEECDISDLLDQLMKYDPLKVRSAGNDEAVVSFYSSKTIKSNIEDSLKETPYAPVLCKKEIYQGIDNGTYENKIKFLKFFRRTEAIIQNKKLDLVYDEYLANLFWYNTGKLPKLKLFYRMVENGIYKWNGSLNEKYTFIEQERKKFYICEKLNFKFDNSVLTTEDNGQRPLNRFGTQLKILLDTGKKRIQFEVDYSLYFLLKKMYEGYIPTVNDKNNHAEFSGVVQEVIDEGEQKNEITIFDQYTEKPVFIIKVDEYGYEFRVVE